MFRWLIYIIGVIIMIVAKDLLWELIGIGVASLALTLKMPKKTNRVLREYGKRGY